MNKRILIIDDNAEIRKLIRTNLEKQHYEVFEAVNGIEASIWFNENQADLAIVDVVMPEMDGVELAYEVKRRFPEMPVVAISAGEHIMSKEMCLELMRSLGAVETIPKPFDAGHLVSVIQGLIGPAKS